MNPRPWFIALFCACVVGGCQGEKYNSSPLTTLSSNSTCTTIQFQCKSGRCLPSAWQCDNEKDCSDGSDEDPTICSGTMTCLSTEFRCKTGICIPRQWQCDGNRDCSDGSDEDPCEIMPICTWTEFRCKSGQCILRRWLCDGNRDCPDGSDEDPTTCSTPRKANFETTTPYTPDYNDSSSSEEDTTIWLSELQFITRTNLSVDINLPRIGHTEKCTFITPDNKKVRVEDNNLVGVKTYNRSDYVSCRIVIGPMEESLIGKWTICGSYTEGNVAHKRCQIANVAWSNGANPSTRWHTTIQPEFHHVVHFYGALTPSVRGSGTVVSCHLVTPNNEDLFVTRESKYPNIRLVQDTDSVCSIAIGPIKQSHLGSWIIYGKFNSTLWGYNEARFPMKLDLYNKNHPYDQSYNVTQLTAIQHVVNLGNTIAVEVASTGAVDVCIFTMPSGMSYNTIDHDDHRMPTGVAFVKNNRIACRISIGPITQNMVGTWMLIGRFSNRGIFTEMIQWFNVWDVYQGTARGTTTPYAPGYSGSWEVVTHTPQHYFNTEPTFRDWYLKVTTITPSSVVDEPHLHSNTQSDRVVVEMPKSLATDQDLHFAMSLVPMLHRRSLRDKLDTQMHILSFFKSKLTRDQK